MSTESAFMTPSSTESMNPGRLQPSFPFSTPLSLEPSVASTDPWTYFDRTKSFRARPDLFLKERNYSSWESNLRSTATLAGIWPIIEFGLGSNPSAVDEAKDIAAQELIRLTISEPNQTFLFGKKSAHAFLSALKEIYLRSSASDIMRAEDELRSVLFTKEQRMIDHLRRVEEKVIALSRLGVHLSEPEWCARIIASLRPMHQHFNSLIQGFDIQPESQRSRKHLVAQLLADDDRRRYSPPTSHFSGATIHAAASSSPTRSNCEHCGKSGHEKAECFRLHPELREKKKELRGRRNGHRRSTNPKKPSSPSASPADSQRAANPPSKNGPSSVFFKPAISSISEDHDSPPWPQDTGSKSINTIISPPPLSSQPDHPRDFFLA